MKFFWLFSEWVFNLALWFLNIFSSYDELMDAIDVKCLFSIEFLVLLMCKGDVTLTANFCCKKKYTNQKLNSMHL